MGVRPLVRYADNEWPQWTSHCPVRCRLSRCIGAGGFPEIRDLRAGNRIVGVDQLVRNAEPETERASLCRCIVVAVDPLVRNAE